MLGHPSRFFAFFSFELVAKAAGLFEEMRARAAASAEVNGIAKKNASSLLLRLDDRFVWISVFG